MKNLYIIVGASGVGKDTLVNRLVNDYGFQRVITYTDRPRRNGESETSHIFVTREEFSQLRHRMLETNEYNGYRYGATAECYDNADIVILEPVGAETIKKSYNGRPVKVIGLWKESCVRAQRMRMRGDSSDAIQKRIAADIELFAHLQTLCDFYVEAGDLELLLEDVKAFIDSCEPFPYK